MKRSSEVKSNSNFLLCRFLVISFVRLIAVILFHECKKNALLTSYSLYFQFSDRISNFYIFIIFVNIIVTMSHTYSISRPSTHLRNKFPLSSTSRPLLKYLHDCHIIIFHYNKIHTATLLLLSKIYYHI